MKMFVDGESCPCCDVVGVTLQFRLEDSIARSVQVSAIYVVMLFPVAELARYC